MKLKQRINQALCYHYNRVEEGKHHSITYYYCPDCGKHYSEIPVIGNML